MRSLIVGVFSLLNNNFKFYKITNFKSTRKIYFISQSTPRWGYMEMLDETIANEIIFGKRKYLHKTDDEYDYLIDNTNNKIKINLKFTKDTAKNEEAINGLKTFFTGISL